MLGLVFACVRPAPSMHRAALILAAVFCFLVVMVQPARAATLLRDPDIEYALDQLATPILQAAGLSPTQVQILIVDDRSMNAFVLDGRAIFIHSGLILKLETAAQLQAVIAHEAAHIANGHISRRLTNMRRSQNALAFGMAVSALAAASGNADAATGLALGSTSAAQRSFLAHTRAEESAADQSGVRFMIRAGVNPQGAIEVQEIFRGQEALSVGRQDPYVQSHPLNADRLRTLRALVAANPAASRNAESADYWFTRAQGKLSAFSQAPSWTLRRVRNDDSLVGSLRRAVAYHRQPDARRAIAEIDQLVAAHPNDPFLHELRGQILLESRQFGAAVTAYGRAVDLAPNNALILGGYGRALLAVNTADANARALRALEKARDRDGQDARVLRDLGQAYARAGDAGRASLAQAERFALLGRMEDAALHAQRAADQLPRGSASWQRALDVLSAAEEIQRR
jgi:predicted Zn-dependent protease